MMSSNYTLRMILNSQSPDFSAEVHYEYCIYFAFRRVEGERKKQLLLLSILCQLLCFSPTLIGRVTQDFVLGPLLVISCTSVALNAVCVLTAPKVIFSPDLSRLLYRITYLTYPVQCLIDISNIHIQNWTPDLFPTPPQLLPSTACPFSVGGNSSLQSFLSFLCHAMYPVH